MFVWAHYFALAAFALLLVAAIRKRREPAQHCRLLAFASIAIIAIVGPVFAMPGMLLIMLAVVAYDLAAGHASATNDSTASYIPGAKVARARAAAKVCSEPPKRRIAS